MRIGQLQVKRREIGNPWEWGSITGTFIMVSRLCICPKIRKTVNTIDFLKNLNNREPCLQRHNPSPHMERKIRALTLWK